MDSIISFIAQDLYIVVVALALIYVVAYYRSRLLEFIIAACVIGAVAYLFSKIGTNIISDPRPFIQTGVPPLIPSARDNGFPSDHTLLLAALAASLAVLNRWAGIIGLGFALLIGLSRVYSGVHHLLDIFGSLIIVAIAALIYLAGRELWRRRMNRAPSPLAKR